MPASKQGDEQLLDHLLLTDNALANFAGNAAISFA
jgi:hypothetical protein